MSLARALGRCLSMLMLLPTAARAQDSAIGGVAWATSSRLAFFQSIGDHNPVAVTLFVQVGMSPNQKNRQNCFALNHAVILCAS